MKTLELNTIQANNFRAGKLDKHLRFWRTITRDYNILNLIYGTEIELVDANLKQEILPEPYNYSKQKRLKIDVEIKKMLSKGVIILCDRDKDGFVSNIFTRDKPDGSVRIILDLSEFNKNVTYRHFKMDSLQTAIDLMSRNCLMASIDWKDAYYSVPIAKHHQKFLQFEWEGQNYCYTCYPNGLSSAPRLFTKLTKVLFSELRKKGFLCTNYIDDCLLVGNSVMECKENVIATVEMSTQAGFVIHPGKSVLEPVTNIDYLGFTLDSADMTVSLPESKVAKIKDKIRDILRKESFTIRELSQVIGMLVASFPGVEFGKLFYRRCDNYKTKKLKENKGNFSAKISLPNECKQDLIWWLENLSSAKSRICKGKISICLESDASGNGWGGCLVLEGEKQSTGGNWAKEEQNHHINYLELLGAWLTVQSFCKEIKNTHIKLLSDNTTAIAYINNMGGTKEKCNELAHQIWLWCIEQNNWLTATHLPGKLNTTADKESRSVHDNTEWKLNCKLFQLIIGTWKTPTIDLFASRLNYQLPVYCSYKPDPGALAVDAFCIDWKPHFFYAFPPFNQISRTLRKIEEDKAEGILVVPAWPTQPWYSKMLKMCVKKTITLYRRNALPVLSHPWRAQETLPTTKMIAAWVSAS